MKMKFSIKDFFSKCYHDYGSDYSSDINIEN